MSLIKKYTKYGKELLAIYATGGPSAVRDQYKMDVEDGNVNVVLGFIVAAVVMAIGVVILYNIEAGTPDIPVNSSWSTIQTSLATTTQSGYGLLAITLIIMAAVGILGALYVLMPRQK